MSDEAEDTYYSVLEVSESSGPEEIRVARNRLVHEYHPDKVPQHLTRLRKEAEERTSLINEAYGVLSDPTKRKRYDEQLQRLRAARQPPPRQTPPRKPTPPPRSPPASATSTQSSGGTTTRPPPAPRAPIRPSRLRTLLESEGAKGTLWVGGSAIAMVGSLWFMQQVTTFSFAWWIGAVVFVASIPGVVAGVIWAFLVAAAIGVALLILWGLVELVQYFVQNPY